MVTLTDNLIGNLLKLGQGCFVMTDGKNCIAGFGVYSLYNGGKKLSVMALEFSQSLTTLGSLNSLTEIILRVLSYYSAEFLGIKLDINKSVSNRF